MFVVSDPWNGGYRISAMFCGPRASESAKRWAGRNGKVTRLRSIGIWTKLQVGAKLPARYIH